LPQLFASRFHFGTRRLVFGGFFEPLIKSFTRRRDIVPRSDDFSAELLCIGAQISVALG